ncbi:MAG: redox-sensing transcriptional repressor Rex [Eubacterium sp.]|nr:redox-sensing transcriptional repressor Rex [Eubacterium sp.]
MEKKISSAVINRLPRYYRYLSELLDNGIDRISSQELSRRMHVTASQIRQDFNNFGGFGQQGYGYNVEILREEIGKILGLDKQHRVIILGAGNLGQALANYGGFERRGFLVAGIFDINPQKIGKKVGDNVVMDMAKLQDYVTKNPVDIAALTLPKSVAPEVAGKLMNMGVRAFWNFAATDLNLPEHVAVENVHLAESLMRLSYNIVNLSEEEDF